MHGEKPPKNKSRVTKKQVSEVIAENARKVANYASRYAGRGAEREDLMQEGYLAILKVLREHSKKRAKGILASSLKGMVRDAAARLRRRCETVPIAQGCGGDDADAAFTDENLADERSGDDIERMEIEDALERLLEPGEMRLADRLMDGSTHSDIARELGLTQQAVSARVQKLRRRLKTTLTRNTDQITPQR
ncbi:MAG: sigma-70 family RNA polymerase sigma factor [Synergistaceae bacterium]|jgi:RNA polymerase sigma factor (sigma-70 family)|nr:sigma-70 family RNA polymerase sigma factor [Synergistaceae bacterium]